MEISVVISWLALVERELMLFAGVFFLVGALDELAVDAVWGWLRLRGRVRTARICRAHLHDRPLAGPAALLIPAWREERVIADTIEHALKAWPQRELRVYVGCYPNDPETIAAARAAGAGDTRLRVIVGSFDGPSSKPDCLNSLYDALERDERTDDRPFRLIVLQDAEDMVDPAALPMLDAAIDRSDFVQLPVLPEPQRDSRWLGSHYCEEFAEAHGKAMVVRSTLAAGLPAAGVGCAFARAMLARIADASPGGVPFSAESLTEDYELGLRVKAAGGRSCFLRMRGEDGRLVATRAYFPSRIGPVVRQKARWMQGIALHGWDRMGWARGPGEWWMRLRDRRGPISALVLFAGYMLMLVSALLLVARTAGLAESPTPDITLRWLLAANAASFTWRVLLRFAFTAREYGPAEGLRAVLRVPVSNVVTIIAGRRALFAYLATLAGLPARWDKTEHDAHPAARPAYAL